jgi:hypothetical protein
MGTLNFLSDFHVFQLMQVFVLNPRAVIFNWFSSHLFKLAMHWMTVVVFWLLLYIVLFRCETPCSFIFGKLIQTTKRSIFPYFPVCLSPRKPILSMHEGKKQLASPTHYTTLYIWPLSSSWRIRLLGFQHIRLPFLAGNFSSLNVFTLRFVQYLPNI